jgi:hypothetical protein
MTRKLKKGQRIDRNPKTGTEVPNSPRRVIVFTPSAILKQRINRHSRGGVAWVAATFRIYWDTFWSLFVNAFWFMTIASHRRKRDVPFLSTVPPCHSKFGRARTAGWGEHSQQNILFIELPGEHGSRRHRRLRARERLFVKRHDLRFGPKAPFWLSAADFRSTLMNGHIQSPPARLKGAINMMCSTIARLKWKGPPTEAAFI